MSNTLLIILRMAESKQPHMDKLQFMVLIIDDHISMSMTDLNDENYSPPVIDLDDDDEGVCLSISTLPQDRKRECA